MRWVGAYDLEIAKLHASGNMINPWFFRYIPFANLYDLSIAFAFGAGIATLLLANRKNFQFLSAFTLPLAALILTLARFIGGEFINLPPVLDSYWRPIHVGVASLSYGVALVCFAVAVIYLLKDRVKPEAMAILSSIFALSVIATVSKFSVFTEFVYRTGLFVPNANFGETVFRAVPPRRSVCRRNFGCRRSFAFGNNYRVYILRLSKQRSGEESRTYFIEIGVRRADYRRRVFGFGY